MAILSTALGRAIQPSRIRQDFKTIMAIRNPFARKLAALLVLTGILLPAAVNAAAIPWEGVELIREPYTAADGITRDVTYLRPPGGGAGAPAVFLLHYNQAGGQAMANLTDAGELARDYNVWVILPVAEGLQWSISPNVAGSDHVAFLSELIDHAIPKFGMDAKRVYMFGYSQGGNMTVRFACERPGKIAAGATVAANMLRSLTTGGNCEPSQGTPMLFMVGTNDNQVAYGGTIIGACTLNNTCPISARNALEYWANLNQCTNGPTSEQLPNLVDDGTEVIVDRYSGCAGSSEPKAQLYSVVNGGHVWPGALDFTPRHGLTTQDIKAGPTILNQFFLRFRLP